MTLDEFLDIVEIELGRPLTDHERQSLTWAWFNPERYIGVMMERTFPRV